MRSWKQCVAAGDCITMTNYANLHLQLSSDQLSAAQAESAATSLPLDGTILLQLVDLGVSQGDIDPASMMSAQQHLSAIADRIERDGVFEEDLPDLIAKIRLLSEYATTRPIPMDPW